MHWLSDGLPLFSSRRIVGSRHRTCSTNHHHLIDNDVVPAPSRSLSTPHILPLPELKTLFRRDSCRESAADRKSDYILPSPEDANKKFLAKNDSETPQCNIASLHHSRSIISGVAYHYQTIPQRINHNSDCSSVHNSEKRTCIKVPSLNSSLLRKLSFESPVRRPDSNTQVALATVHPLPLPPGAAGLTPSSSPQAVHKPDLVAKAPSQSRWRKGKLIGRGTFGSVYVGSDRETGALCAMKEVEILPDDPNSVESINQLEQEIDVLSQLKHPNIVQYYGSEIFEDRLYIYLEYVHPGSINKYVRDHCGGMTESIVRNFTRHIVSGLAYLHSTKTIHRDIKGANLLVDANGVVKLADFGMAKHLDGQVNLSMKGSPYWMAPEGEPKDGSPDLALAVDIWSLGCTIIEMMNGKPPWSEYEGPAALFKVMKETPPIPETMSPDGKDFLRSCFTRNPAERPTANMLLEHKFLMVIFIFIFIDPLL
ncbi:putative mitogen-activated protein kinase kinase kinase STE-STE11 family [Helianthus debilis subsp. tardiflorus]